MGGCGQGPETKQAVEQVLGYLNFSSGAHDPRFFANLNRLWGELAPEENEPLWQSLGRSLNCQLEELSQTSTAFQDASQGRAVLNLVWQYTLPAYLDFHRDLLFHQTPDQMFNSFLVGRICEGVLAQSAPWDETDRIVGRAIRFVNDFLGYRPIAVLEGKKIDPYAHERVRPIPLYLRGVGVAAGEYAEVVTRALQLLEATDQDLLRASFFDPNLLDELAIDPRAYDFDHPANKRPNYHFGMWDPHQLDNQSRYRRFVLQQVTVDALMQRLDSQDVPREELLFEAAAVLAGIILMAAGVSGSGPDTHDSTTSLAGLLPRIAANRDAFYERLLSRVEPAHAERLLAEAAERRQPFGSARQHLNSQLARRRASQLEHVHLAKIFARMGYPEAAAEEARIVPTPAARMLCEIDCRMTAARRAISQRQPEQAAELLREIVDWIKRGIECGAIVDPWNILGFDGQFSLFPAIENSVHDHRVDELIAMVEEVFGIYSHAWSEAAARDLPPLCERLSRDFRKFADWWRQYAAHTVSNVDAIDALDAYHAAEHVTQALNLWHKGGAAAGNIAFWAPHAEMFDSAQGYALVIEALLDQNDYVAAMALLVRWLGAANEIPLEQGESSFHRLADRWLLDVRRATASESTENDALAVQTTLAPDTWKLMRKFFDYLEANAEEFWHTPHFDLLGLGNGSGARRPTDSESDAEEATAGDRDDEEEEQDLFRAAYEEMVFRDSTDDGVEGSLFETGSASDDELTRESERIFARLTFLSTLAHLWKHAGLPPLSPTATAALKQDRLGVIRHWSSTLEQIRAELQVLLDEIGAYRIPTPRGDHDSMVEYDRRHMMQEVMLDRVICTSVEAGDAARLLAAAAAAGDEQVALPDSSTSTESELFVAAFAAILRRDDVSTKKLMDALLTALAEQPLLYVPLAKGGQPKTIVATRIRQRGTINLLRGLPRLGLYFETFQLLETARAMERDNPVGAGAVTEFDELFKVGYKSIVQSLVISARDWPDEEREPGKVSVAVSPLVACLEQLTETCLRSWLAHSQTLRLSVLEKVSDKRSWTSVVEFIERYGSELFTQRFLNLGNIRAILHQGVDRWLQCIQEEDTAGNIDLRLLDELDSGIPRAEAVGHLTLVLESILENFGEYRDYNSTTTQSDRGEMLHMLLDFLRLRAKYDRVCWNLKPVVLAHEMLVRRGCKSAAQQWRRALRDRIDAEALKFIERLQKLQKKHAMQMPSIADRISERFMRPLVIDRLCSLVEPAIQESYRDGPRPTFRMLQYETEFLTREPTGVGFDLPAWLAALDDEVQRALLPAYERDDCEEIEGIVPLECLSYEDALERLADWTKE